MAIPLPALSVNYPNPSQTMNQFGQLVRLRELALAQQAQQQNEQARTAIAQQEANQQGQEFATRQAMEQQEAKDAAAAAQLKQQQFESGQQAAQQKSSNDYLNQAYGLMAKAAKIGNRDDANKTFLSGLQRLGDDKDYQFFNSIGQQDPDKLYSIIKSQSQTPSLNEQELAYRAAQGDPAAQKAIDSLNQQKMFSTNPMAGVDNGKQTYAYHTPNGFISADGKRTPLPNFQPVPSYGAFMINASNAENPNVQNAAQLIASYQMSPPSGYALSRPEGQALMAAVKQINPDYNANGYNLAHELISGPDGRNIGNLNTAIKHMNALDAVAASLGNANIQARNRVVNWAAQQLGSAPPVTFDALKSAVASEVASALKGNATDQEIKNAEGFINKANSPTQMNAAINNVMEIMAQKLGTYQERFNQATGGRAFAFKALLPEAGSILTQRRIPLRGSGLPSGDMVRVNLNGQVGEIPKSRLSEFMKKYPAAKEVQ